MFLVAVAFLVGHCIVHSLAELPAASNGWWLAAVCAVLLAAHRAIASIRGGIRILLALVLGFGHAGWQAADRMAERWPSSRSGTDVDVLGFVASIVEERIDSKRFRFDVGKSSLSLPSRVEVTLYDTELSPQPGEYWRLRIRLRSPRGFANPGGFDYEAQLLRENIGATGYVRNSPDNRRLAPAEGYWVLRCRAEIARRIAAALPDSKMVGIVQGLAIGDTSQMNSDQWRVFAITGTTHLMAISGMHIGMVALALAWLAGRCARFAPLQRRGLNVLSIEAVVGLFAALSYSALAGFSIPTQRTLIMLCVYFGTRLLRREISPSQGLSLALVAVLIADPFAPLAVGFWLSFGAVGAIFVATAGQLKAAGKFVEFGRLQWTATIALLPLVIVAFGTMSLISPFVNLVAIPFFTLAIVPLVLTSSALLFVGDWIGSQALNGVSTLLEWGWLVLEGASRLPYAMGSFPPPSIGAYALLVLGALIMLAPGLAATRISGFVLCLPALFSRPERPHVGDFEVAMLDVGQGLALVVSTANHDLLYDAGPSFRGGRNTGELVVVPYLRAKGIRRLDTVVVSHGDSDHIGGLDGVAADVRIDRLLLGPSVGSRAGSERCEAGQRWEWDGVRFEVLFPPSGAANARRNDSSCVLRVVGAGGSILFFGDIERAAEQWLLDRRVDLHADIVVVPHHGSKTSSTLEFVETTKANYALMSAGYGNQWGFPKAEVVARWRDSGAMPLQTALEGAIEFRVTSAGTSPPRRFRREQRRYWRTAE